MSNEITTFEYNDHTIRCDKDGRINLTDMWRAVEGKDSEKPANWLRFEGSGFVSHIAKKLKVSEAHLLSVTKGRNGGTHAHWQIALAYSKYLSHDFHMWANQVLKDRIEEDANPDLAAERGIDRAVAGWRKQGWSEKKIQARLRGIGIRHQFTDTLQQHGVTGYGYGQCTNAIYKPILGGKTHEVREARNLPAKANLRDSLSLVELAGIGLAEALASEDIEDNNHHGIKPCVEACTKAGGTVGNALAARNAA